MLKSMAAEAAIRSRGARADTLILHSDSSTCKLVASSPRSCLDDTSQREEAATQCQAGCSGVDLLRGEEGVDDGEDLHGLAHGHAHAVTEDAATAAGVVRAVVDAVQPAQTRPLQRAQPLC